MGLVNPIDPKKAHIAPTFFINNQPIEESLFIINVIFFPDQHNIPFSLKDRFFHILSQTSKGSQSLFNK